MPTKLFDIALLTLLCGLAIAAEPSRSIPDTTAGHALGDWLDSFNSGDRQRLEAFDRTYSWQPDVDGDLRWRSETGGYDLLEIYTNDQTHILFRLKARATVREEIGTIALNATEPRTIVEMGTFGVPAGSKFEAITIDNGKCAQVINEVTRVLRESYVFPEIAHEMSAALRERKTSRENCAAYDGRDLARRLTSTLRDVSNDKHLEVRFSYVVLPMDVSKREPGNGVRELAANCGFEKAEHFARNIGYLKFNFFANAEICGRTAAAAMNFLSNSDALVLDLRDNNGGTTGMVEFLATYLFAESTHLNDIYSRRSNTTTEGWTLPYVPGNRFVDKPVFVLTSGRTFSAAEDLAYALKNLKRATLVGEATGGGAHPIDIVRIDDHVSVVVPNARSISPITRTDWEGAGVEPDVKVSADQALDTAINLAEVAITKRQRPE